MTIDLLPGAKVDLRSLRASNPDAFAAVMVFLEEAEADKDLIDKCTSYGNVHINAARVNVKRWVLAQGMGNIFRIRILDTPASVYRVVWLRLAKATDRDLGCSS